MPSFLTASLVTLSQSAKGLSGLPDEAFESLSFFSVLLVPVGAPSGMGLGLVRGAIVAGAASCAEAETGRTAAGANANRTAYAAAYARLIRNDMEFLRRCRGRNRRRPCGRKQHGSVVERWAVFPLAWI